MFFTFGYFLRPTAFIVKNNCKVHLHLIIQYETLLTFLVPIRENIDQGRSGSYEVFFSGLTALGLFLGERVDNLSYRTRTFSVVNLGSQAVTVRLHWLPVYIKESVVEQVCSRYGEVIDVVSETSQCDICNVVTGVRLVRMRLSIDVVNCLPHIVSFRCGSRVLVSVRGRPHCDSSV